MSTSKKEINVISENPYSIQLNKKYWKDLFIEDNNKNEIKQYIDNFFKLKDFYKNNKIPWRQGLFLVGPQGNGKKSIIDVIASNYNFNIVTSPYVITTEENLKQIFNFANNLRTISKSKFKNDYPTLLYFKDLDISIQNIDFNSFTNALDNLSSHYGIFIIASSSLQLKPDLINLLNYNNRFDKFIKIPKPNKVLSEKYLEFLYKESNKEFSNILKYNFSYSELKQIFIKSFSLSKNIEHPEILKALRQVKNNIINKKSKINFDKYLKGKKNT